MTSILAVRLTEVFLKAQSLCQVVFVVRVLGYFRRIALMLR